MHQPPRVAMPLIDCPSCGQKVASVASVCPRCSSFLRQRAAPGRESHIIWPIPVLVIVLVLSIVILGIPKRINTESQPPTSSPPAQLTPPPATVAPPPIATPRTTGPSTQTKWISTWVNVREGRGTDTPIVQILSPGQPVEVGSLQGRWWDLYIDGERVGYVHNSVLQNESPGQ
jgi:hypothetical protein